MLCDDLADPRPVGGIAERLRAAVAAPLVLGDEAVSPSISVWAAVAAGPDDRPERLLQDADAAMYRAKRGVAGNGAAATPTRVFLCDDVPDLRALLRAFLEQDGAFAVVGEAGDGAGVAGAVAAANADVVLLDLSMPDVDGLEAIAALRAADRRLGIIVLSGFERARMEAQALALGADRYLEKRAGMAEVRRTVAEVAARRREA